VIKKGNKVLIRTATYYQVGEIDRVGNAFVHLKNASWVADTGRFSTALAEGPLAEVEVIPGKGRCSVSLAAIVDVFEWAHPLPKEST
jgi:hypothetical protein